MITLSMEFGSSRVSVIVIVGLFCSRSGSEMYVFFGKTLWSAWSL